jgi:nucleotide-binding universal stress UspA family protein
MALTDILLQLSSYPDPTPHAAVERAVAYGRLLDGIISGVVCHIELPPVSNYLANKLIGADKVIAAENRKSSRKAAELLSLLRKTAGAEHMGDQFRIGGQSSVEAGPLVKLARVHDLTILPMYRHGDVQFAAEAVIFGSGRPVLLLPRDDQRTPSFSTVVVAWDGGRPAARAIADALPILKLSQATKVVRITEEKNLEGDDDPGLRRHLARHAVLASFHNAPANGDDAATALLRFCKRNDADLLVIGAYGHSRLRDVILGGVTKSFVSRTPLPVFLSH